MFKPKKLKGNTLRVIENLTKKRITEYKIAQETYGFKNVWSQDEKMCCIVMQMKGRRLRVAYD